MVGADGEAEAEAVVGPMDKVKDTTLSVTVVADRTESTNVELQTSIVAIVEKWDITGVHRSVVDSVKVPVDMDRVKMDMDRVKMDMDRVEVDMDSEDNVLIHTIHDIVVVDNKSMGLVIMVVDNAMCTMDMLTMNIVVTMVTMIMNMIT